MDATDCTISTNAAETLGGGIFTSSFFEVLTELDDYDFSAPDINVSGGEISSNTSMVSGGGILMFGGDVTQNQDLTYTYESQLNVDDAAIIGTNSSCFGGGIYAESAEIAVDGASVITENSALGENISGLGMGSTWSGAGGGIVAAQSSLTLGACEISLNAAERDVAVTGSYSGGGGIMGGGRTFISVNDESALISENSSTYGGGICTDTLGTLDIVNGIISANIASNGAGVYSQNDLTMSGGVIGGNNAGSGLGGGIFSNNTVEITGGIIGEYATESLIGNTATSGGGIYSSATGTVTISGGTVDGNTVTGSSSSGGGIFSANQVYINGGTISNNTAVAFGGGVYGKYVEFEENGTGVVSGNKVTSTSTTKGYGGGIYISSTTTSGGSLIMNSGTISNNITTTAARDGAGVYISGTSSTVRGTMTMTNYSIINNNKASRNGGGVYLYYSDLTMSGNSEICYNTANNGGGVYRYYSTVTVTPPASVHDNTPNDIV